MKNTDAIISELLPQESRYMNNLNVVDYQGSLMYDIPYRVRSAPDEDDSFLVTTTEYQNRLDKISNSFYMTPKYWWVVANINKIINPFVLGLDSVNRLPQINKLILRGVIK